MSEKCGEYDEAMTYLIWVCCAPRKGKLNFIMARVIALSLQRSSPPLSKTRSRTGKLRTMSTTNLERTSSTSISDDVCFWRGEGKETVCCCSQRWICALRVSLSFCSYLRCCLNLMGSFRLVDMKTDRIHLLT